MNNEANETVSKYHEQIQKYMYVREIKRYKQPVTLDDQVETSRDEQRKVEKSRGKKREEMRLPLFRMSAKSIIPVIGCSAAPSSTNR